MERKAYPSDVSDEEWAYAAIQIWRRRPVRYLLSGLLLFKASFSGILLTGGEFLKIETISFRGQTSYLEQ